MYSCTQTQARPGVRERECTAAHRPRHDPECERENVQLHTDPGTTRSARERMYSCTQTQARPGVRERECTAAHRPRHDPECERECTAAHRPRHDPECLGLC